MSSLKLMPLVCCLAALSACTTQPPLVSFPTPPEALMRPPLELRSLPSPARLPTTTSDATKTPSS